MLQLPLSTRRDSDSGANVMFPGDMEMNFDRFSAYPDPSAVDFNDPSFQYFNFPDFNDDVPAQSYVDPSAIIQQQPLPQPDLFQNVGVNEPFNFSMDAHIDTRPGTFQQNDNPSYAANANDQMETQHAYSPPSENSFLESTPDLHHSNETPPTNYSSLNNTRPASTEGMKGPSMAPTYASYPPSLAGSSSVLNSALAPATAPKKTPQKRGRKRKPLGTLEEQNKRRAEFLERNRTAAFKCRTKKKAMDAQLQEKVQSLDIDNQFFKAAVQVLCSELEGLVLKAKKHTKGNCCADDVQAVVQRAASALEASRNWAPAPSFTRESSEEEEEMDEDERDGSIDFHALDAVHTS